MRFEASSYNPLLDILELFNHEEPKYVLALELRAFESLLTLGGVICESQQETVECLKQLSSIGLLTFIITDKKLLKLGITEYGKITKQNSRSSSAALQDLTPLGD